MWPCPDAPHLPKESCYIHIQDQRGAITVPNFVIDCAMIMHVKDSLSIITLPSSARHGFEPRHIGGQSFKLKTLWASQLLKARYIWNWSAPSDVYTSPRFHDLTYLHLDFCPRLVHILPFGTHMIEVGSYGFRCLETLEMMWCGDLRKMFPFDLQLQLQQMEQQQQHYQLKLRKKAQIKYIMMVRQEQMRLKQVQQQVYFPKLKRIHLHELPSLHSICEPGIRMSAPELESIKIRGCWSLKCLPTVQKAVQCDCEKEWWDSLQWEDASQKKLYKPIHPRYYKKTTLLKGSVLR